jgi:predicted naringenin-chalcone synthase
LNSDISFRHAHLDLATTDFTETLDELHERFRSGAMEIGVKAIQIALERAGLTPQDIDFIADVSCTGYLCPGLSALYIKELDMRRDVQRADLLGMGCAGAMPGLQRAHDFVRAYPEKHALVIAVEICSACYYMDEDLETVVGNAICADGAAAAVIGVPSAAAKSPMPRILGFETLLEPAYIHTVGFVQKEGRLKIVLSKDLRSVAGGLAKKLIDSLLDRFDKSTGDIKHWILHSGGRKVIDSIVKEMGFEEHHVTNSRTTLRNFGNMSSPTVLFVLDEAIRQDAPRPGEYGVMLAMGPGLALEVALLQW